MVVERRFAGGALVAGGWWLIHHFTVSANHFNIAVVKRVGTAPSHNCQKKKSVKREFLSLRVVARNMNDTNMMYKKLAIDCIYF